VSVVQATFRSSARLSRLIGATALSGLLGGAAMLLPALAAKGVQLDAPSIPSGSQMLLEADTLTSVCCPGFDYDVIMWGWGSDPDPAFLLGVALCSEIPSGFSESGYCDEDYDALYDAQAVELDRDARVDLIHQMQQKLMDDLPYIIPYYYPTIEVWRTDTFTGWLDDDPTLGLEDPSSLTVIRPSE